MLWQSQSSAKGLLEHLWSAIPMGRLTLVEMVEEVSSKLDALESSVDALSTKIKKNGKQPTSPKFSLCLLSVWATTGSAISLQGGRSHVS